jgi:hypothetical protein
MPEEDNHTFKSPGCKGKFAEIDVLGPQIHVKFDSQPFQPINCMGSYTYVRHYTLLMEF